MNKYAIVALLANLSIYEVQAMEIEVDLKQSEALKTKVDAVIANYMNQKSEAGSQAEWSFLQNMANLGAFFSKPGLIGPDLKQKKTEIINVSESLQAATLV